VEIFIANKRLGEPYSDYVGRGHPLGNPFSHLSKKSHGAKYRKTRELAIFAYREWLTFQIENKNNIVVNALKDLRMRAKGGEVIKLGCFCHPKPCHAEVIREFILDERISFGEQNVK